MTRISGGSPTLCRLKIKKPKFFYGYARFSSEIVSLMARTEFVLEKYDGLLRCEFHNKCSFFCESIWNARVALRGCFPRLSGEKLMIPLGCMETSYFFIFLDYARFSLKNAVFNTQLSEGLDLTVH